ncbi:MAG: alpha-glucosidase [Candidatus Abyssobacteria bacterium SURF_5]|uniref:Alpha-glucosidase n=1 Tax=Abyssobacteria bacterium (strain SURF_5) TaxID=2093360 RepID=A0A3A4NDF2_ABYX5|nr:MAG: alpha-glucosidase [Candidatus Abyssubacteria bacterium SURF_5]
MNADWWKKAVVYQIYPRSFLDTDADGIGNLNGITEKLDYLNDGTPNSLGIDAIWLNPFYPSPQCDFGYDVMDYYNVDPQYGAIEDFDRLLAEAHKRSIKIIMDVVPGHTSHLHPWFIESRSSKRSPKRDWYIWKPPRAFRGYPNNWLGVFGGRAWDYDGKTREYYYHNSLPEQPDLNWRNPEMAKAFLSAMAFWLDKGVDGFRIDVINYTMKDQQFRNNPLCLGRRPYDMQRHIYDKDRPDAVEVANKMRALTDKYPNKMLVGEVYIDNPDEAARYLGENGDGLHMAFNFSFMFSRFRAEIFKKKVETWERAIGDRGWPAYFLSNHDYVRHISRYAKGKWTEARARVAAAMLLTLRGTPFVYQGEEIGMRNLWLWKHEVLDPIGRKYWPVHPGRDGERTPMQWNSEKYAGFSTEDPWLRVHPNHKTVNVALEEKDPTSLLNFYKKLIRLRKENPALQMGDYKSFEGVPEGIFAYLREGGGQKILIALNFTQKPLQFSVGKGGIGRVLLSPLETVNADIKPSQIKLPPCGILIAEL